MTAGIAGHALGINNRAIQVGAVAATPPLVISNSALPDAVQNVAYSADLDATGLQLHGRSSPDWSAVGLPAGLAIDPSSGLISGTPTAAAAPYPVIVTVDDDANLPVSKGFMLSLSATSSLAITTASLPDARIGTAYSRTMAAANGLTPYTWSATIDGNAVPDRGLTISPSTGVISGTPSGSAGTRSVVVTVSDSNGVSVPRTFSLVVAAAGVSITTASLPDAVNGTAYSKSIAKSGGVATFTWGISGQPTGLSINGSGLISGTPDDTAGTYHVTVSVSDGNATTDSVTLDLVLTDGDVDPAPTGFVRTFGMGRGNMQGAIYDGFVNTTADAIQLGTNRVAGGPWRYGLDWPSVAPNGGVPTAIPGAISAFNVIVAQGGFMLIGAFYCPGAEIRQLTFPGSTAAGNRVNWTGGVGAGLDPQLIAAGGEPQPNGAYFGGGAGLSIHGPGISGVHYVDSQDPTGLNLDGGVTAGQSGTYTIGGSNGQKDTKIWPKLPSGDDPGTTLSNFGEFVKKIVGLTNA